MFHFFVFALATSLHMEHQEGDPPHPLEKSGDFPPKHPCICIELKKKALNLILGVNHEIEAIMQVAA